MIRWYVKQQYNRKLEEQARDLSTADLEKSAMIFAPHEDDETLGCGGTIIRKRQIGAPVQVVFMTDGRTSHNHLLDEKELMQVRFTEAMEACDVLGVDSSNVYFLDYADSELAASQQAAIDNVVTLLNRKKPEQIFVPHPWEQVADHQATAEIVLEAVRQSEIEPDIFAYPVWLWDQWPWTSPLGSVHAVGMRERLASSMHSRLGQRVIDELTVSVPIGSVLQQKSKALRAHRSQMNRFKENWPTLRDVGNGDWLDCFFGQHEYFGRIQLPVTSNQ